MPAGVQWSPWWDRYLLQGFLPGVDAPVDDQIAAGTKGTGAELADIVPFICGAEERKGLGADPPSKNNRGGFQDVFQEAGCFPSREMEMINERLAVDFGSRKQMGTITSNRDANARGEDVGMGQLQPGRGGTSAGGEGRARVEVADSPLCSFSCSLRCFLKLKDLPQLGSEQVKVFWWTCWYFLWCCRFGEKKGE